MFIKYVYFISDMCCQWYKLIILTVIWIGFAIWYLINEKGGDDTKSNIIDLWDLNISEQVLV